MSYVSCRKHVNTFCDTFYVTNINILKNLMQSSPYIFEMPNVILDMN